MRPRFVLPGQVMLGEAKLRLSSLDRQNLSHVGRDRIQQVFYCTKTYPRFQPTSDTVACQL